MVYVDHDPVVLRHARALLASAPPGTLDYIDADLRDPAPILARPRGGRGPFGHVGRGDRKPPG